MQVTRCPVLTDQTDVPVLEPTTRDPMNPDIFTDSQTALLSNHVCLPPKTETSNDQHRLGMLKLWKEVLGFPVIDDQRTFRELSGDSLAALRIVQRILSRQSKPPPHNARQTLVEVHCLENCSLLRIVVGTHEWLYCGRLC